MRRFMAAAALLALTHPMPSQTLEALTNRNRVLLLFAPTAADPRLAQQLDLFKHHAAELHERDLVLLPVFADAAAPITASTLRTIGPLGPAEQQTLRLRFHVAPNAFAAILVGKDGGEKLRASEPIALRTLESTIDAMPMRQDEMRNRKP